jgi:hypothetical protein
LRERLVQRPLLIAAMTRPSWGASRSVVVRASSGFAALLPQHCPCGHATVGRTTRRSSAIRVVAVSACAIQGSRAIGKRQARRMIGENALAAQRRCGGACARARNHADGMPRVARCASVLSSAAAGVRHLVSRFRSEGARLAHGCSPESTDTSPAGELHRTDQRSGYIQRPTSSRGIYMPKRHGTCNPAPSSPFLGADRREV